MRIHLLSALLLVLSVLSAELNSNILTSNSLTHGYTVTIVGQQATHQFEADTEEAEAEHHGEHHIAEFGSSEFWEISLLALFLAICGAFCSGMTVGLLSISTMELEMLAMKTDPKQREMGQRIYNVVKDHHLFLVTLLIANAIALESLPLVVHGLMPDWAAILFSTFVVLIVAEIIPQSVCTGPNKLVIAYYAAPIIQVMIKIFWILSYPIGKGLDFLMGEHSHQRLQHKDFVTFLNEDSFLKPTQKLLLTSTLELRGQQAKDIMISVNDFYMLEENTRMTEDIIREVKEKDYSYVLVYREKRSTVVGAIKVKEFAVKCLQSNTVLRAGEVMKPNANMLTVYEDTNLLHMLMIFQAKSTRVALVCNLKRKLDPTIESIMYSKSDMVYTNQSQNAEVIGVVFLYQLFSEMAELENRIQQAPSHLQPPPSNRQMQEIQRPLL